MTNVYSHRNGETEPPAITGRYWFKGEMVHRHKGQVDYISDEGNSHE